VDGVGFRFLPGNDGTDVLDEVDATFFAFAAGALAIAAGRAFKTQGMVAARTKAGDVASLGAAFRTFVCGFSGLLRGGRCRGPGNIFHGFRDCWGCGWCPWVRRLVGRAILRQCGRGGAGARILLRAPACSGLRRDKLTTHARILVCVACECGTVRAGCIHGVNLSHRTGVESWRLFEAAWPRLTQEGGDQCEQKQDEEQIEDKFGDRRCRQQEACEGE
jgi:hypothetical protein